MDSRISHIIPTITCSNCQVILPIRELSSHECEALPIKPSAPLKLDTSFPSLNQRYYTTASTGTSPLDQVPELLKSSSKSTYPGSDHSSPTKTRPKISSNQLHRTLSTESSKSGNETWKIARRPTTGSSSTSSTSPTLTSPLSALSRSFSIESSSSPKTPYIDTHHHQQPYLSFRIAQPSHSIKKSNASNHHHEHEQDATATISFFKATTPVVTTPKLAAHYHQLRHRQQGKDNPNCFRCKRAIRSEPIPIGSKHMYHSHCLTCFLCRDPLNPHKEILEYNGIVYCLKDYQFIHSRPTCATCHDTIEPPIRPTKAFGNYFHPEHLRCTHCHKPVDEETTGIVRHKKKLFCRTDFNALYLPTCRGCGRAVERESVSSSDGKLTGKWHKHCFRCHACSDLFQDSTFYVHQNQPYCQRDYHRLNHSLCAKCDTPIEGRCAQTSPASTTSGEHATSKTGDKYHPHCFTCHQCDKQIKDIYYSDKNRRIYCPDHGIHQSDKRTTIFCDLSAAK